MYLILTNIRKKASRAVLGPVIQSYSFRAFLSEKTFLVPKLRRERVGYGGWAWKQTGFTIHEEKMSSNNPLPQKPVISTAVLGVLCCALAAVSYTASNACLRQLSTMQDVDPAWTTCIKESMAWLFAGFCVMVMLFRRSFVFPPKKEIGILIAVGLAVQLVGNLGILWAMGKIGLAVSIPTNSGTQLVVCALFGRLILGERVTFRSSIALGLLLVALIMLGCSAEEAGKAMNTANSPELPTKIALAVLASCIAGVSYASLSISMRRSSNLAIPQTTLLFIVAGIGVATMWPISYYRVGVDGLLATSPQAWKWLLSAGFFNLIGFFGFAKGLQLTSVIHASVLNASQVAMSAIVGMVYFQEPRNPWLFLGVCMTLLGIMLIDRPSAADTVEVMV
jgi:drug/metabolite transporter (DMT)-like permease